ncbi:hypothetical protein GWK47_005807 [Chionoecetes opilio]|uniref:Uncharacterized protein n=1 Tax=Chionoecetes opilio TaxID=41210 RepID=A0A8J4YL22_CHIOP|nr:hypothetical protein GWK47_005807 [Chionoecetes opilio]
MENSEGKNPVPPDLDALAADGPRRGVPNPKEPSQNPNWFIWRRKEKGPEKTHRKNRASSCYTLKVFQNLREETLKEPNWKFKGRQGQTLTFPPRQEFRDLVVGWSGKKQSAKGKGTSMWGQVLMKNILSAKKVREHPSFPNRKPPLQVATAWPFSGDAEQSND